MPESVALRLRFYLVTVRLWVLSKLSSRFFWTVWSTNLDCGMDFARFYWNLSAEQAFLFMNGFRACKSNISYFLCLHKRIILGIGRNALLSPFMIYAIPASDAGFRWFGPRLAAVSSNGTLSLQYLYEPKALESPLPSVFHNDDASDHFFPPFCCGIFLKFGWTAWTLVFREVHTVAVLWFNLFRRDVFPPKQAKVSRTQLYALSLSRQICFYFF